MRKWMISLLSILALASMFTGCGDKGSVTSNDSTSSTQGSTDDNEVVVPTVDEGDADVTTPSTPYNLSSKLGTPPGLPN